VSAGASSAADSDGSGAVRIIPPDSREASALAASIASGELSSSGTASNLSSVIAALPRFCEARSGSIMIGSASAATIAGSSSVRASGAGALSPQAASAVPASSGSKENGRIDMIAVSPTYLAENL
jgi:hypothetical protein